MSSRIALALLLITSITASASPSAPPPGCPTLSYGPFPVDTVHITKAYEKGTPSSKAEMDTPDPNDYPANTSLTLHDSAVSKQVADGNVTIYNLAKVYSAPHKTIQPQLKLLKKMLADRSTTIPKEKESGTGSFSGEIDLPDYPSSDCTHLFQGKLHYIDTPWGSGMGYITVFCQDIAPPTNEDLCYVFMGLSKDGKYMVSVQIHVTNPKLVKSYDDLPKSSLVDKGVTDYNGKIIPALCSEPDANFKPTIGEVEKWISALKFD